MTNHESPPGPLRRGLATGRLEAFSDGVFAIAITLLVLDIAVPVSAEKHLLRSVADLWPSYLGYVVSVSTIGAMWLGHNAITEYLERADVGFVRLNLLLLLVIAFFPFPTRLFAEEGVQVHDADARHQVARAPDDVDGRERQQQP